jgi:hypothetical protein
MRTRLLVFVLLVAFATLVFLVSAATAAPGRWSPPKTTTQATKPVPKAVIVPKTATMLGGSTYPWVTPVWTHVGWAVVPTLPRTIHAANTQPPAWIPID